MKQVDYGRTYKILRKKSGVTLEQAADGIIDASTLSRWENGKGNMYFDNVVQLIKKLNLYYDEFIAIARGKEVETNWDLDAIFKAYDDGDLEKIKQLSNFWESQYQVHHQKNALFYLAAACSSYKTLTGKNIMSNSLDTQLNYLFKNVKHWGQYFTQQLGNCVEVVDTDVLYQSSTKIIIEIQKVSVMDLFRYTQDLDTLLGIYYVLIKRNLHLAKKLQTNLQKISFPAQYMELKIIKDFLDELLEYSENDNYTTDEMDEIIKFLNKHGYENTAYDLGMKFKSFLTEKANPK